MSQSEAGYIFIPLNGLIQQIYVLRQNSWQEISVRQTAHYLPNSLTVFRYESVVCGGFFYDQDLRKT